MNEPSIVLTLVPSWLWLSKALIFT